MSGAWRVRACLLTLVGALVVHQGRYAFVPRPHDHELAAVHGYLSWLIPLAGVLLFMAAVQLAMRLRRPDEHAAAALPTARALWIAATFSLLASFGLQEVLESVLSTGALPASEALSHGGWVVLPLAVAVGGVLAMLLRGAAAVAEWALARTTRRRRSRSPIRLATPSPRPALPPRGPLIARFLAARAPPRLSS